MMTNKEIAEKLGISPAALSLVINHKPGVSDATREGVLTQLREMGYEHLIKKAPAMPSNNLIFIIFKKHGEILDLHPFFLLLMENIEACARNYGYNILLYTIDQRRPMEPQIRHLNTLDSQGAIIFATEMQPEDMGAIQNLGIPVVALDNDFTNLSCNAVSINNQMGTFQAIEHLISHGILRIGYLKSRIRISSFDERQQGYEAALALHHLSFLPEDVLDLHYSEEGSYRDMSAYLKGRPVLPEAFVADDDTIAIGVLRALIEHGYRVPEDISIIGFNDRPSCTLTEPPLSTINVSKHVLAAEAVEELVHLIRTKENSGLETRSKKIRIGTKLIERQSIAPPKKSG